MDYDLGFHGLGFQGLKKLSISEVKSWLDQAETYQNLEVNPEKIKEFAGLFYPTANRIVFQFGGEYNDSGYDLSICNIQGAIRNLKTKEIEYLPLFDFSKYSVSKTKSLEKDGYEKLSKFINSGLYPYYYGIDDIFADLKCGMIDSLQEVNSEFLSDKIVFNLETGELEGLPSVPDIYGNVKDFQ